MVTLRGVEGLGLSVMTSSKLSIMYHSYPRCKAPKTFDPLDPDPDLKTKTRIGNPGI